jgi:hypothetical protein
VNAIEVVVVSAIVIFLILLVMMRLPRSRETARSASCRSNLMRIGVALAQYHADVGSLPRLSLDGPSPLRSSLEQLAIPDFRDLSEPSKRLDRVPGLVLSETRVEGFVCPTDTVARVTKFAAPVNYRASTGSTADGLGGAFELGATTKLGVVEEKDGISYTAAYSERLIGDAGPAMRPSPRAMQFVPAALTSTSCPGGPGAWLTEGGASWWKSNWASTLYNHALTPNADPSCLSANGSTGLVGASSEHVEGVNVLLLDGSVKSYGTRVAPEIWRRLGTIEDRPPLAAPVAPGASGAP